MVKHIQIVAMVLGAWGAFQLFIAMMMGLLFFVLGGGLGALGASSGEDELMMVGVIYGMMGPFIALISGGMALPNLIAAWGLNARKSWSRILGMIVSALACMSFPIGTVIGVYGLYVLLDKDVAAALAAESA